MTPKKLSRYSVDEIPDGLAALTQLTLFGRQPSAPVPPEDTGLWCVYITGMDDLIPMPDRAMADRRADHFNQWSDQYQKQRDPSRDWPVPRAEVKPWPYAPADHAEALAELRDDDPDGWLLEPATPETPRVAHRSL